MYNITYCTSHNITYCIGPWGLEFLHSVHNVWSSQSHFLLPIIPFPIMWLRIIHLLIPRAFIRYAIIHNPGKHYPDIRSYMFLGNVCGRLCSTCFSLCRTTGRLLRQDQKTVHLNISKVRAHIQ